MVGYSTARSMWSWSMSWNAPWRSRPRGASPCSASRRGTLTLAPRRSCPPLPPRTWCWRAPGGCCTAATPDQTCRSRRARSGRDTRRAGVLRHRRRMLEDVAVGIDVAQALVSRHHVPFAQSCRNARSASRATGLLAVQTDDARTAATTPQHAGISRWTVRSSRSPAEGQICRQSTGTIASSRLGKTKAIPPVERFVPARRCRCSEGEPGPPCAVPVAKSIPLGRIWMPARWSIARGSCASRARLGT